MKNDLLEIIRNYGVLHQLEYYQTEVWELNNAIQDYKYVEVYKGSPAEKYHKEHIAEELADNFVMLTEFQVYYNRLWDNVDINYKKKLPKLSCNIESHLKEFQKDVFKFSMVVYDVELIKKINGCYTLTEIARIREVLQRTVDFLRQVQKHYGISDKQIKDIMLFKIKRQLERIEEE